MPLRKLGLYLMALLYVSAGINHFINPQMYIRIVPPWLPAHAMLVTISGVAEILLGLLVLPQATRSVAAWSIIALLIAIFPANIQMALDWQRLHHSCLWIAWIRLPIQAVLMWWAWRYTRLRRCSSGKTLRSTFITANRKP